MSDRLIVPRLCSPVMDGIWQEIAVGTEPIIYTCLSATSVTRTTLVPTGTLEWEGGSSGGRCAEVYVPADRLAEWRGKP